MSSEAATLLALVLAGAAGALLPGGQPSVLDRLASPGGAGPVQPSRRPSALRAVLAVLGLLAVTALLRAVGLPVPSPTVLVVGATMLAAAAVGGAEGRRRAAARAAPRRRAALGEALAALSAELRAGAEPVPAMAAAAAGLPELERLAAAAQHPSGDVRRALADLAAAPGGEVAGDLGAAWLVADLTGCALAAPVARVLEGHRARERLSREVTAQMAGPTATAYLLSGLPVVGAALGAALGADPLGFLVLSAPGRICLVAGLVLVAAGIAWTRAITGSVLRGSGAGRTP